MWRKGILFSTEPDGARCTMAWFLARNFIERCKNYVNRKAWHRLAKLFYFIVFFFFRKINVYFSVEIYCKQSFETIHGGMLWCPICVKKRRHHISGAARPLCVWPPFASRTGLCELSEWDMIMLLAAIGQCSCKFKVIWSYVRPPLCTRSFGVHIIYLYIRIKQPPPL